MDDQLSFGQIYSSIIENFSYDFSFIQHIDELAPQGPLLDLGGGTGRLLKSDIQREFTVIDIDGGSIEVAKSRGSDFECLQGDARKLAMEDDRFACVVLTNNSLSEMRPCFFVLGEAVRVLKEGGLLFVQVLNPSCESPPQRGFLPFETDDASYFYRMHTSRDESLGPNSFNTFLDVRDLDNNQREFSVRQTLTPIRELIDLCQKLGMTLQSVNGYGIEEEFDQRKSPVASIILRKETRAPSHSELIDRYDGYAAAYDEMTEKISYGVPAWVTKQLLATDLRAMNVLDIGCADGVSRHWFEKSGITADLYGIDASKKRVEQCQQHAAYKACLQWNLNDGIPIIDDRFFDCILVLGVLEFVENQEELLASLVPLLDVGGRLYLSFEQAEAEDEKIQYTTNSRATRYLQTEASALSLVKSIEGLRILKFDHIPGYRTLSSNREVRYLAFELERSF